MITNARIPLAGWGTLAVLALCLATPVAAQLSVSPVVPAENEMIIRDQLIILVDVTGSIISAREFDNEKSLVQSVVAAMPDGTYEAGLDSFAGVAMNTWLQNPLARFDRMAMAGAAAAIEPLGSFTPLARGLLYQKPEVAGRGGRGALLLFSDGRTWDREAVLEACRDLKAVHGNEFCIYTVHIGPSTKGAPLLQEMAAANGCGKYYEASALNSEEAIHQLVRDIFIGPRPVVPPAPAGVSMDMKIVYFDNDSAAVKAEYNAVLDEVAALLKAHPDVRIGLSGHTDSNASNAYNQRLSERRIAAVKAALAERGADAARIESGAYGEEMPAAPNDTRANRQLNRRVEIRLLN